MVRVQGLERRKLDLGEEVIKCHMKDQVKNVKQYQMNLLWFMNLKEIKTEFSIFAE